MTEKKTCSNLKNIGPVSTEWLRAVGVASREDLERLGSIEAYRLVKEHGFNSSLNLLYALEATLLDIHWTALSSQTKAKLKAAARLL